MFSRRVCNFLGFLGCVGLIAFAYFYMEKVLYLNPCPLCYAQRVALAILGFFFLIATIFPGKSLGAILNASVLVLFSAAGAALSIRHLWLQSLPKSEIPSCGPDIFGLFESTPWREAIATSLSGSGDCAEVQWTMFSLTIPGWTLIAFIGFGIWALMHNLFRR